MKYLLLLLIVCTGAAHAQGLIDASRSLRLSGIRSIGVTSDGKLIGASNPDVEGSPFFDTAWNNSNLSLANGDVFFGVKTRLNIFNSHLHFVDENGNEMSVAASELKRIEFTYPFNKDSVWYTFEVYTSGSEKNQITYFYQVLSEGKLSLLKLLRKHIDENTNAFSRETTKAFVASGDLFVYANEKLTPVKRKESFWQELLQSKWTAIQNFVAKNNLGYKSETDIEQIVDYFNAGQ